MVHRIDSEGAVDGRFQPGDAGTGLRATRHDFAWLNAQQEEVLGIVGAEGLTPTKGAWTQRGDAITKRIGQLRVGLNWSGQSVNDDVRHFSVG